MRSCLSLWICVLFIIISSGLCEEVAYSYGKSGDHILDSGNITEYNGSDIVTSAVASENGYSGSIPVKPKRVEEIKREINLKLNVGNPAVRAEGRRMILEYPGDGTISQICSIYDHMVSNWSYARDTRGIEEFQYSNQSLVPGGGRFSGQGDCDDFSILLASLIESIGGTSRIMLAYGPMGGHAYTEVYLGEAGEQDSDVVRMVTWLKKKYKVDDINTHNDLTTGDVWLNLDWWKDPNTRIDLTKHPGGPFFNAPNHTPIPIREDIAKVPLNPLNDLPLAMFTVSPNAPNERETVTFDASLSRDIGIGGQIDGYLWDFGDGEKGDGKVVTHAYSQGDRYQVNLVVVDNEGERNNTTQTLEVNALPIPIIDYQPKEPIVENPVSFNASKSWDKEDEKISKWLWEFGDGESSIRERTTPHRFKIAGTYPINLTVYDKNNANKTITLNLKINEPPTAKFSYSTEKPQPYPNEGEPVTFDASDSKDLDGNITAYMWTFGDDSPTDANETTTHIFKQGGIFTASLRITDDNNATVFENRTITVNWLPIARISPITLSHALREDIVFDASNSSDNESNILRYSWDFNNDNIIESAAKREAYSYRLSGQYAAKLTVTDENGASNSTSVNLDIIEPHASSFSRSFIPESL